MNQATITTVEDNVNPNNNYVLMPDLTTAAETGESVTNVASNHETEVLEDNNLVGLTENQLRLGTGESNNQSNEVEEDDDNYPSADANVDETNGPNGRIVTMNIDDVISEMSGNSADSVDAARRYN